MADIPAHVKLEDLSEFLSAQDFKLPCQAGLITRISGRHPALRGKLSPTADDADARFGYLAYEVCLDRHHECCNHVAGIAADACCHVPDKYKWLAATECGRL